MKMRPSSLLSLWSIPRAPDDAGGGAPPPAAAPAAGTPSAGDAGTPPPAAPPAGAPPASAPPSSGGYRPDGMPDDWLGQTDQETIDRLAKVAKGYRERDSKAGVPEDPAEYRQFETVDDKLKPYFATLEGDGMFDDLAAVAKEHGVSKPAFQAIVSKYMAGAAELGILEPPVDKSAERAELLPEGATNLSKADQDRAIDQRMNDNLGWLTQMQTRGLDQASLDYATMMLGDSAKGHKFIEFFRSQMTGADVPRPNGGGTEASRSNTRADLTRRSSLPENTAGHPKFDKASYDALQADYRRAFPDEG